MSGIIDSLDMLISNTFIRYRGCLIEKIGNKYKALGIECKSEDEAKIIIDNSFKNIEKKIKNETN